MTAVPSPVHVMPSVLVAIVLPPCPTAVHRVPFHATRFAAWVKIVLPSPIHAWPSILYASVFVEPWPHAIHIRPFHAACLATTSKIPLPSEW